MQAKHGRRFEPDQDPYLRRWAARFNLAPDDRVVVMTATIEQLCSELSQQFDTLQHTVDERQEQWTESLTTTNQTVQQALRLIHQQQTNQTGLTQTYAKLTDSLLKFEQALHSLNAKIAALSQSSPDFTSDLIAIRASLSSLSQSLNTVRSEQSTLHSQITTLRTDPPDSNASFWLGFATLGLVLLNVIQFVGYKVAVDTMTNELQAIRGTVNSSLIRLERLEGGGK